MKVLAINCGSWNVLEPDGLRAIGHRIVHGGGRFADPVLIDDKMLSDVATVGELAPLHNSPALSAIHGARSVLGDGIPMVAVFDTALHRTLLDRALTTRSCTS